ncbi:MAG: cysteine--tRNA ligase [Dehalococcoidia bacterium]|nr:cysteine--tRNA ligase [Dehalococcoidia bacterium]
MALRLYSSLGNEKREFRPLVPGEVRMYVCGVTPYDVTHLGHAFSYVQFDTLRRYLTFLGNEVRYVQNITDIDDDMIMVSRRQGGRPIAEIRDENDAIFRTDLDRLNVLRPWHYPKATEHIPEIIETTAKIIENGAGYVVDGDVFFEAAKFARYGQLNGVTIQELAKRENPESKREYKKRGPLDFLLWQVTEPDEPSWESPWGPGRPGWSIECTAMSSAHLGHQIDIHGGGRDLVFPHHENEIAQAETAFGLAPFCGWWMHNGMVKLDGVKMSKSLGNLVLARNLMSEFEPDHLRMYLVSEHYRTDADFHASLMPDLLPRYERLKKAVASANGDADLDSPLGRRALERLDDDLDTPGVLGVLDAAAEGVLSGTAGASDAATIHEVLRILGFAFAGARGPANGDMRPLES